MLLAEKILAEKFSPKNFGRDENGGREGRGASVLFLNNHQQKKKRKRPNNAAERPNHAAERPNSAAERPKSEVRPSKSGTPLISYAESGPQGTKTSG